MNRNKKGQFVATHGMTNTPEFEAWHSMKCRCLNSNDAAYAGYGGRGIKICDRWIESFENFYEDMGDRPEGMSLDREDNDGSYTPENCRWATWTQQARNRSFNVILEVDGISRTVSEWAEITGIYIHTIYGRLARGWPHKKAVTEPVRSWKRRDMS